MSVRTIRQLKKYLCVLSLGFLLSSCSENYSYADEMIDIYEEAIDNYEDAEDLDELQTLREEMRKQCAEVEKDEKESHQKLIQAIESFDEDAYLIHLDILYAESHAQWMYHVKEQELKK